MYRHHATVSVSDLLVADLDHHAEVLQDLVLLPSGAAGSSHRRSRRSRCTALLTERLLRDPGRTEDSAVLDQPLDNELRPHRSGSRGPSPLALVLGQRLSSGVDADHLVTHVDQRAAGVAMVDRGVGLQGVNDGVGVESLPQQLNRTVQCAEDALRDGTAEPQRRPRGDHLIADADLVGVTEPPSYCRHCRP